MAIYILPYKKKKKSRECYDHKLQPIHETKWKRENTKQRIQINKQMH